MPPMMPSSPAPPEVLHDVVVVRSKKQKRVKIDPVPPEEFGISRNARTLTDCDYCFHKVISTEAKLIAQGFDERQVKALPSYVGITNTEEIGRDTVQENQFSGESLNTSARRIEVTENYVRMDYEGNGKPCLYKVTTFGRQGDLALKDGKPDIEQFDAIPFAAMTPVIVTHRFFGRSIADLVMDIQRIKTAILRGILDNTYLANNPRVEVAETHASADTLDDLLVSRPGGIVRTKQPGGLNWQEVPNIAAGAFPIIEYMDTTRELRTGVTRQGQGIDANALQNQSATAVNQVFTAAQARIRLIARIFAETGIRDLFQLIHATIRKHGQEAQTVKLKKQWVQVDPRDWKTRYDMTIHVGLGQGSKAERLQHVTTVGAIQKDMLIGGKSNLVSDKNLYNTAAEVTKLVGMPDVDQFFCDPEAKGPDGQLLHPPPPPQPDPKLQIEALKAQHAAQVAQLKQQGDERAAQMKASLDQQKSQFDAQHQIIKTQTEAQLAERKAAMEARLAEMEHAMKMQEAALNLRFEQEKHMLAMRHESEKHAQALELAKHKAAQPAGKGA